MMAEISSEVRNLKTTRKELRKFSTLLFFLFTVIAGLMFWKGNSYWTISAIMGVLLFLMGLVIPTFLKGFYRVWMTLGFVLGWIMTQVILTITFFLIFTPIGLLLKILRKDLLDEKIEKTKKTYWKKHEPISDRSRYLKQF